MRGKDFWIRTVFQQQLHQGDIAGLRRAQEGRRAVFEQPLHGEIISRLGAIANAFRRRRFHSADSGVHLRTLGQEQLDVVQMVHIRRAHRIVAAFNIAVISRKIQGRPAAAIRDVRIRAVIQQIRRQFVVPVLRRHEQGSPPIMGSLIHIGARLYQNLGALQAIFAGCVHQRS